MNYVYLDNKNHEFLVDDETYGAIVALVQAHKLCVSSYQDRHPYTDDNPCVGRGICLQHVLKKQPHLVYAGSLHVDAHGRHIHRFLDEQGVVYTSTEDSSDEASRNIDATLAYYGFTPPETITARGKTVTFYSSYATLHGDLHTASVMVLEYHHYHEKVHALFLLYKHGPAKELAKKSDLYHRADALVETTKDSQGYYHLTGSSHPGKVEADTLAVVSQLESALYDVTIRLQQSRQGTDNQTGATDA